MSRGWAFALAFVTCATTSSLSRVARAAYQEVHPSAHDVRLTIDGRGAADVDDAISYRVMSGAMHGFDLDGIAVSADLTSDVSVTGDDGATYAARVGAREMPREKARDATPLPEPLPGARPLRVEVLDAKGLKRGSYTFHLHYRLDLASAKAFTRDGGLWRLAWTSPPLAEGLDGMRVVFDLPAAPTEPRLARIDGSPGEEAALPTLRRAADRDVLEIVRPHVARAEPATWALRVDPRAFPGVTSPELRPPPPPREPARDEAHWTPLLALLAFGLASAALARAKLARVEASLSKMGLRARPLLLLPIVVRAAIFGALVAAATRSAALGAESFGAALLALAFATVIHLAPRSVLPARGPGAWRALRPGAAFDARLPGDALDATTGKGLLTLGLVILGLALSAALLRRIDPSAPGLVALLALALAPIFFTGTRRQLPPHRARSAVRALRALYMRLRRDRALRVAPWARFPTGASEPDELRLRVLPRAPLPGLVGVEVGIAWRRVAAGFVGASELLVRVHEGSAAAAKLTALAPFARPVTGRRDDERVVRIAPVLPTAAALHALVARLGRELVDRRLVIQDAVPWRGVERRLPRNTVTAAAA